ncbi:hypothetical protein BVY01_00705 [bacterium I07]|nr:hypothetical protein BVY01_00705 [bacterium I07]
MAEYLDNIKLILSRRDHNKIYMMVDISDDVLCLVGKDNRKYLMQTLVLNSILKQIKAIDIDWTKRQVRIKCGYCKQIHLIRCQIREEKSQHIKSQV